MDNNLNNLENLTYKERLKRFGIEVVRVEQNGVYRGVKLVKEGNKLHDSTVLGPLGIRFAEEILEELEGNERLQNELRESLPQ